MHQKLDFIVGVCATTQQFSDKDKIEPQADAKSLYA